MKKYKKIIGHWLTLGSSLLTGYVLYQSQTFFTAFLGGSFVFGIGYFGITMLEIERKLLLKGSENGYEKLSPSEYAFQSGLVSAFITVVFVLSVQ